MKEKRSKCIVSKIMHWIPKENYPNKKIKKEK